MDAFYRLLLQSVLILLNAFAATGIAAPWMKCTSKVGQKCKTFGGAFFMPKKSFAKKIRTPILLQSSYCLRLVEQAGAMANKCFIVRYNKNFRF